MQFESKVKRTFWVTAVLGLIPDVLIAAIIAAAMDGGALGFLVALVGLQVLYFLIWLKNTIWSWVVFSTGGRKKLASLLIDYLRENKYPEPDMYQKSAKGYFESITENESLPVVIRLQAAAQLAALSVPASQGQVQHAVRLSMAYEDAIEGYKGTFPKAG